MRRVNVQIGTITRNGAGVWQSRNVTNNGSTIKGNNVTVNQRNVT